MKILVTGAGGKTGKAVIAALAGKGVTICALTRRPITLPGTGNIVTGDMTKAADWERAMTGMDRVYHIGPNMHPAEVAIGRLALAAAGRAGVSMFVYHSVLHPQIEAMNHHWRKMRVEQMLLESGLPFTILQPTAYMQNIRAGWPNILRTGRYVTPYPVSTRISLVDLADVAEAAAVALTQSSHSGATYELVGTPPMSQLETAQQLSQAAGQKIVAAEIDLVTWHHNAIESGLPEATIESLLNMFRHYAAHGLVGSPTVLGWLLGHRPASLVDCARGW